MIKRSTAIFLFLGILLVGWPLVAFTSIGSLFIVAGSPVLLVYEGITITQALASWSVLLIVIWPVLVVLAYAIDDFLGYITLRIGLELLFFALNMFMPKDSKLKVPEIPRQGSGGRSPTRVG